MCDGTVPTWVRKARSSVRSSSRAVRGSEATAASMAEEALPAQPPPPSPRPTSNSDDSNRIRSRSAYSGSK